MPPTIKSRVKDRTVFYRLAGKGVHSVINGERQTYIPQEPMAQTPNPDFDLIEPQRHIDSSYEQERRRGLDERRIQLNAIWGKYPTNEHVDAELKEAQKQLAAILITTKTQNQETQTSKCCTII
jgi:hypothetical protein